MKIGKKCDVSAMAGDCFTMGYIAARDVRYRYLVGVAVRSNAIYAASMPGQSIVD